MIKFLIYHTKTDIYAELTNCVPFKKASMTPAINAAQFKLPINSVPLIKISIYREVTSYFDL